MLIRSREALSGKAFTLRVGDGVSQSVVSSSKPGAVPSTPTQFQVTIWCDTGRQLGGFTVEPSGLMAILEPFSIVHTEQGTESFGEQAAMTDDDGAPAGVESGDYSKCVRQTGGGFSEAFSAGKTGGVVARPPGGDNGFIGSAMVGAARSVQKPGIEFSQVF
ncbi:hypothetical protein GCM10009799_04800 [Nocardiopsis rhodophaea]|uniref:Uncharacterized protein n=1 Tax=Nocardiopsis rhodophaea TaxID=280238 RepID=A0ABN2S9I5_9ACTN